MKYLFEEYQQLEESNSQFPIGHTYTDRQTGIKWQSISRESYKNLYLQARGSLTLGATSSNYMGDGYWLTEWYWNEKPYIKIETYDNEDRSEYWKAVY